MLVSLVEKSPIGGQLKEDLAKTHTYMQQWVIEESRPEERHIWDFETSEEAGKRKNWQN
ncbi:hypothetical protein N9K77_01755 [bacterium]|nr:hypothetical protein [bacterium]